MLSYWNAKPSQLIGCFLGSSSRTKRPKHCRGVDILYHCIAVMGSLIVKPKIAVEEDTEHSTVHIDLIRYYQLVLFLERQ